MVERLPQDVSYERVIYHLEVMKSIETGLQQADKGEVTEHDEFMRELEAEECGKLDSYGRRKPKKTSGKSGARSPAVPQKRRKRSSVG